MNKLKTRLAIGTAIIFGVITTVFLYQHFRARESTRLAQQFRTATKPIARELTRHFDEIRQDLAALRAFFETAGHVSNKEFAVFTGKLGEKRPGVIAYEWAPRVSQSSARDFEVRAADHLGIDYRIITVEAGSEALASATDRYPILFVEPLESNRKVIGLDLGSETLRRAAIMRALRTGRPAATAPIRLVQRHGPTWGTLLFERVSDDGVNADRHTLPREGVVLAVFDINVLMTASVKLFPQRPADLELQTTSASGEALTLFSTKDAETNAKPRAARDALKWTSKIPIADQEWRLHFTPTASFLNHSRSYTPALAALAGALASVLIGGIFLAFLGRTSQLKSLVKRRSHELEAISENVPALIAYFDRDLRYQFANRAYAALFLTTPQGLIGRSAQDVLGENFSHVAERMQATLKGQRVLFEILLQLKGVRRWCAAEYVPDRTPAGEVVGFYAMITDIDELKRAEIAARESSARLDAALAAGKVATWQWCPETDTLESDQQLATLFGIEDEQRPETIADLLARVAPHDRGSIVAAFAAARENEIPIHVECDVITAGETVRHLGIRGKRVADDTSVPSIVGAIWDLTDIKRYQESLAAAVRDLERSNAELEQFAYVASHDLQEPLRMVSSFCQLIHERYTGKLDKDADEFIGFAVDGARRMQAMIRDLLQYSRAGRKTGPVQNPAATDQAIAAAQQNLAKLIYESQAKITVGPLPPTYLPESQLQLLFQNLIANALKFRSEATPVIEIRGTVLGDLCRVTVRDNGIGIKPQFHQRIFKIFQRLHTRDEYAGTGIGLALCRRIVERYGGEIGVDSSLGAGSIFWLTLPIRPVQDSSNPPAPEQAATAQPTESRSI